GVGRAVLRRRARRRLGVEGGADRGGREQVGRRAGGLGPVRRRGSGGGGVVAPHGVASWASARAREAEAGTVATRPPWPPTAPMRPRPTHPPPAATPLAERRWGTSSA